MLRIKNFDDNRDELLKFGFKYIKWEYNDLYIYEKELFDEFIEIEVDTKRGLIQFGDMHRMDRWYIPNVIYDLIESNLVEKVEEWGEDN